MNKDELRKLVKEASNRVDILAGFLPSVGTKKERDMLLNDIYIYALKRDIYYALCLLIHTFHFWNGLNKKMW